MNDNRRCLKCGGETYEKLGGTLACKECGHRMERPLWVTVARACTDCGGERAVLVTTNEPSLEEQDTLALELGGMYCIQLDSVKVVPDQEVAVIKYDQTVIRAWSPEEEG